MIGLLLATKMEAHQLLQSLTGQPLPGQPFDAYTFPAVGKRPGGFIVISGMGKLPARKAAEWLIDRGATAIVNVGICGALNGDLQAGELLCVSAAVDGDQALAGNDSQEFRCDAGSWANLPQVKLATVDEPVFQLDRREALARHADVVDMEGIAVAAVCSSRGVLCTLLKGVSDLADASGKADLHKNIHSISAKLADELIAGLSPEKSETGATGLAAVLRFAKVEHSVFSLPLLFAGAWLGSDGGWPSWQVLALIALAGIGARTLGMAMNRILDRRLDALNQRTAQRELPSGKMSLAMSYGVAAGGGAIYLLACWGLGPLCLKLSAVPVAPLIVYSLLKRFTVLCHFGIGLCLGLAPLGAFVAASGSLEFNAQIMLLALYSFCWISGFDIIYAVLDIDSDRQTGVRSIPAAVGCNRAQIISALVHLIAIGAGVWLWQLGGGGIISGIAMAVAIGGFMMGYWQRLPINVRFFPVSIISGVAGSMVPLLGGLA